VGFGRDLTGVVFDFDGTLLHLDVDWEPVRHALGLDGTGETLGAAIQRLKLAGDPRVEVVTRAELAGLDSQRIGPEVLATLAALAAWYPLAICSRNSRLVVERALSGTPLEAKLPIVGREDCTMLKPDPEGLLRALDRLAVSPAQALLVGDTYHDVSAARAAGMRCAIVRNDRLAYRPDGADRYLPRLADLLPLLTE
jgi:phosphoglycolate phosphatase